MMLIHFYRKLCTYLTVFLLCAGFVFGGASFAETTRAQRKAYTQVLTHLYKNSVRGNEKKRSAISSFFSIPKALVQKLFTPRGFVGPQDTHEGISMVVFPDEKTRNEIEAIQYRVSGVDSVLGELATRFSSFPSHNNISIKKAASDDRFVVMSASGETSEGTKKLRAMIIPIGQRVAATSGGKVAAILGFMAAESNVFGSKMPSWLKSLDVESDRLVRITEPFVINSITQEKHRYFVYKSGERLLEVKGALGEMIFSGSYLSIVSSIEHTNELSAVNAPVKGGELTQRLDREARKIAGAINDKIADVMRPSKKGRSDKYIVDKSRFRAISSPFFTNAQETVVMKQEGGPVSKPLLSLIEKSGLGKLLINPVLNLWGNAKAEDFSFSTLKDLGSGHLEVRIDGREWNPASAYFKGTSFSLQNIEQRKLSGGFFRKLVTNSVGVGLVSMLGENSFSLFFFNQGLSYNDRLVKIESVSGLPKNSQHGLNDGVVAVNGSQQTLTGMLNLSTTFADVTENNLHPKGKTKYMVFTEGGKRRSISGWRARRLIKKAKNYNPNPRQRYKKGL